MVDFISENFGSKSADDSRNLFNFWQRVISAGI